MGFDIIKYLVDTLHIEFSKINSYKYLYLTVHQAGKNLRELCKIIEFVPRIWETEIQDPILKPINEYTLKFYFPSNVSMNSIY